MALGDGTGWDETTPNNNTNLSDGDDHIMDLRKGLRIRMEKEHSTMGVSSAGGQHKFVTLQTQAAKPTLDAVQLAALYSKLVSAKNELFFEDSDGNEVQLTSGGAINISLASAYPAGHLYGGVITNSGDVTNDLDITAVKCRDDADSWNISVGALTKKVDATWEIGTDKGGLDTGTIGASACRVYIFAIDNTSSSAPDILFSKSRTSPTLPSGYDVKRLIGHRYWTGSRWVTFHAAGSGNQKRVWFKETITLVTAGSSTSFASVATATYLDPAMVGVAQINFNMINYGYLGYIAPVGTSEAVDQWTQVAGLSGTQAGASMQVDVPLDSSGAFLYAVNGGSANIYLKSFIEEL